MSTLGQPSQAEWANMTNSNGTIDIDKMFAWLYQARRRRAKELAAAWGTYAPLYFPWHDGTEGFGE